MKKVFLTSLMLFASMFTIKAGQVSRQEALQIARHFMPGKQFVETKSQSRSSSGIVSGNDAFYIFNAEGRAGFVIVSGDDRMPEILGYSDHLLLVGINYDRDTKQHTCKIERS